VQSANQDPLAAVLTSLDRHILPLITDASRLRRASQEDERQW